VFITITVALLLGAATLATILLVRRYIIGGKLRVAKQEGGRSDPKGGSGKGAGRPRIQITGPKVKPLICQICLGRVKQSMEYTKCSCGKVFHLTCISRTGFCPYCQNQYTTKDGKEPSENGFVRLWAPASEIKDPASAGTKVNYILCPLCGANVPTGAESCDCGAIFVEEGGNFKCPECGEIVSEDENECPNCGEHFDHLETQTCPLCGRILPQGEDVCECGAVIGDCCPECRHELAPGESTCRVCGAVFELV
jgi:RNA polymerase subunit RPABC4/transcription elongation factor Spt4